MRRAPRSVADEEPVGPRFVAPHVQGATDPGPRDETERSGSEHGARVHGGNALRVAEGREIQTFGRDRDLHDRGLYAGPPRPVNEVDAQARLV